MLKQECTGSSSATMTTELCRKRCSGDLPFEENVEREPWKEKEVLVLLGFRVSIMVDVLPLFGENVYLVDNMGVSKNNGTPKWMVYNEKPY